MYSKNSSFISLKNKAESGHSLIEIISVLIIMAILFIAALVGFKTLLDYLRKKETAAQISTIAFRYKTDRLGKKRKDATNKISLKEVYPEGSPCHANDFTCLKTPDGGQIQLYSYQGNTNFIIIAAGVSPISCEEAIMAGGYTKVKGLTQAEKNAAIAGNLDFLKSDTIFNDRADVHDLAYFKERTTELLQFCQHGASFIYAMGDGHQSCPNFYEGQCHNCPKNQVEDRLGNCCEEIKECGLCPPGCPSDKPNCRENKLCVECNHDNDCIKTHCGGNIASCFPGSLQYCVDNQCKPCKHIGDPCGTTSGGGFSLLCNENYDCSCPKCQKLQGGDCIADSTKNGQSVQDACHVCQNGHIVLKNDTKTIPCSDNCCQTGTEQCWHGECKPTNVICNACQVYDGVRDICVPDWTKNNKPFDTTKPCEICQEGTPKEITGNACGGVCCPYGKVCQDSTTGACVCPTPYTIDEGDVCLPECPDSCKKILVDGTEVKMECRNGRCIKPHNENICTAPKNTGGMGLLPIDQRNKTSKCSNDPDCPCNSDGLLDCVGDQCLCADLPAVKRDLCWGECGCACGLQCDATGANTGRCQCQDPKPTLDECCSDNSGCKCADGLDCQGNRCICKPAAHSKRLKSGEICAGEDVCPEQCEDTLCRPSKNGTNRCCPKPLAAWCEPTYDETGCLVHPQLTCQGTDKPVCDPNTNQCVECTQHTDCESGYYCEENICRSCAGKQRCRNEKNPLLPNDIYVRCKIDCLNQKCSTEDDKTCVGCDTDEDCSDNAYCDRTTHTCKDCETCETKGWTCCEERKIASQRCKVPTNLIKTATYNKKVNGTCRSVTEEYCGDTPPKNECSTCESPRKQCGLKNNGDARCCKICNHRGDGCCQGGITFGNKTEVDNLYEWFENTSYYVDSEKNMNLHISIFDIVRYTTLRVCEEGGSCLLNNPDVSNQINRDLSLKAGKTYRIEVDLATRCSSCNITAQCEANTL